MSDSVTIARPYAKAIFKYALDNNRLKNWFVILHNLGLAVLNKEVVAFVENPATSKEQKCSLFLSLAGQLDDIDAKALKNLLDLLAYNKRLLIIAELLALFAFYRDALEQELLVIVITFDELSNAQQEQLKLALKKRLQRKVTLDIKINKAILGGIIIKAGDLVIDLSVRGKLHELMTCLNTA